MGHERLAPVDVADIAKVAHLLLREGGHEDHSYDMTGPEALTTPEIAQRISDTVGRSIRYVDIEPDEKHRMLVDAGTAPYFADALDELFSERRKEPNRPCVSICTNGSVFDPPHLLSSQPATPCSGEGPAHDHTRRARRWPTEPRTTRQPLHRPADGSEGDDSCSLGTPNPTNHRSLHEVVAVWRATQE
jgi:hypothetical protein